MSYIIALAAVILGIALDQYTKMLAVAHIKEEPFVLLDGIFELRYLENRGAAFGMLQNQQTLFMIVGAVTLFFVTYLYIRLPHTKRLLPLRACMVLIVAGAIGNMIDRVRLGYVVDFFYFKLINFPIFNVADIFATVSAFGLILLVLFYYKEDEMDLLFQAMIPFRKNKQV